MIFYFYVVPNLFDFAFRADQEGAADDTLVRAAHEFLHAPHAIGFDHFVVGIAQQGKIELLFRPEFREGFFRIGACSQNEHADFVEILLCVTKLGRFGRSTGGAGLGKEEKHNAPSAEICERQRRAFIGLQSEVWCFVADFQHGIHFSITPW